MKKIFLFFLCFSVFTIQSCTAKIDKMPVITHRLVVTFQNKQIDTLSYKTKNGSPFLERGDLNVDPIHVINEINIVDKGDWIVEKNGKYIQMSEQSAGTHSFDHEVKEVGVYTYELYKAKELLLNYLKAIRQQ